MYNNNLTDKEKWELILKHKALIYREIYRYTKNDVDDIWQDVAIELFNRLQNSNNTYLQIRYAVINALRKMNKNRDKIVYVDEEIIDYLTFGGVAV
ncbi:hypothetical protein SAMN05428976_10261 [Clostridium sp. USBA 49]|uniref:RNA polymerase sigma factor n=1 Tax=Clostridium sp. USBA 49 TaxID=1881060 RepID=UPI00099A689C|nr:sigma-70 family RNA polymerase sigma factor [Clostridium sp. USBA 49]SKA75121.1 hypothetical protein SAMN05428976_10261 [Clostridium sp. USBA 49]